MNIYSRALRHIDMNDVKQKHHKKLVEKRIHQEKYKKFIEELTYKNSPFFSNWRESISEQMTSDGMLQTTLVATGDTILFTSETNLSYGPDSAPGFYGVGNGDNYDTRYYDTLLFDVSAGNGPLSLLLYPSNQGGSYVEYNIFTSPTSGTFSVPIPPNLRTKSMNATWFTGIPYETTGYGNWTISNIRFQRRAPMNVFVSLDSPEATAFIRTDPAFSGLSEEEKKEKLRKMLEASDEYLAKIFGKDFPGSGVVPPGESGTTPGVQVTDYQPSSQETQVEIQKTATDYQNSVNDLGSAFDDLKKELSSINNKTTSTTKGIFTTQKSDAFMRGFNQGRAERGLPPMDNMGRTISKDTSSTSTATSSVQSTDQKTIDILKKEIEVRTKLQTTGDAQKYYSSPSMQRALDKLKVDLASREKDFADKYGSTKMPGPDPQQLQKQLSDVDKQIADLKAQAKQNMIDARNNEWTAAAIGGGLAIGAIAGIGALVGSTSVAVPTASARVAAALDALKKSADAAKAARAVAARSMGQNSRGTGMGDRWSPNQYNSYEPEGQLIFERRKLKSPEEVLNKLPGYYDGKPSPLGFPMDPPPETINGYHPDLVDGKKIANRFNRLDTISAKAMPLTGNPHIDKKIKAARKRPK
jgi:hypothetical protein